MKKLFVFLTLFLSITIAKGQFEYNEDELINHVIDKMNLVEYNVNKIEKDGLFITQLDFRNIDPIVLTDIMYTFHLKNDYSLTNHRRIEGRGIFIRIKNSDYYRIENTSYSDYDVEYIIYHRYNSNITTITRNTTKK